MEKSIYKYILKHTRKDQILIILLTLASMPLVYYSLEIPKIIINKAIGGGSSAIDFLGYELTQIQYLFLLSFMFLALVIINGGMKYVINVYRGILGERMLRRFRYTLYNRILRFPLPHFKEVSASEIIPMVTAETEPLGGFIGDAIALPVFQGGLLITYLSFIFVQDIWLGIAAIALYPPQLYLIPRLQKKVNQLSKRRVQTVRKLADRVGETVLGITDIHANDTGYFERADISRRLGTIFEIRNEIFRRKFFIKFLNNFLAQLTPFFFYSIGGYLVLKGELSLGALVAVLAAYKDISPPWLELLKFYQITEDIRIKYAQIIEQFAPENMLDQKLLETTETESPPLTGIIQASRLSYIEDSATRIAGFNFEIVTDQHTAILSKDGTSIDELMLLLARLVTPSSGSLNVGQADLQSLPESVIGQRIGYCSADSRIFNTSIRDNLYYGLKHQPQEGDTSAEHSMGPRRDYIRESVAAGNSSQDADANWVDIRLSGADSEQEFEEIVHAMITCVELDDELLTLALRTVKDIEIPQQLASQIVTLRDQLIDQVNQIESGAIIEPLHPGKYIHNLTVEENLLFGTPVKNLSASEFLATNPLVKKILQTTGLQQDLCDIGLELASLMVELFSDVPDDSELFDQFSFIKATDLPDYQQLITAAGSSGAASLNPKQRAKLSTVSFQLCPARHRLDLVTPAIQEQVVTARKALMDELGHDNNQIRFFDIDSYNHGMSVQENLLFGKIVYAKGHLQPRVTETIKNTLKSADLNHAVVIASLSCQAGAGGSKLSSAFRQKLVLARTLLKNPDILIINGALSALNNKGFVRILDRIVKLRQGRNLIWALTDPELLPYFERVLILEKNKLVHNDSVKSLSNVIEDL